MKEVLKRSKLKRLNSSVEAVTKKSLILAFASGILLFLSFPKYGAGIFVWIALVPLLYAIKGKNPSEALTIGFVSGFLYNVGIIYWVAYAIVKYGNLSIFMGVSAMLLLAAYLGVYTAIFSAGVAYLNKRYIPQVIYAPVLWTCLEYVKSHIMTGFPWENLAYSQYLNTNIIQLADITGIYGITFLIVLINAVIYDIILTRSQNKIKFLKILSASILLFIIYYYGTQRIQYLSNIIDNAKSVEVNLIQGNIDQDIKWNDQHREETINAYRTLSLQKLMLSSRGLIIWPETAVPFYFQDVDDLHRKVVGIAQSSMNWLLVGSPSYIKKDDDIFISNSAFLISPDGNINGQYDKVHLVPYGEYVPLRKYLPFINKIVVGIGDFQAGRDYYPLIMDNIKLGVLICYEGIFPEAGRSYKEAGAGLLVNITNDAWYGRTSAPYQHLSMVIFRSIENRLYLVRAANTGISAIIDATGKIVSHTELFERTSLKGRIKVLEVKTFYSDFGDFFAYICIACLILFVLIPKSKGERIR